MNFYIPFHHYRKADELVQLSNAYLYQYIVLLTYYYKYYLCLDSPVKSDLNLPRFCVSSFNLE